MEEYNHKDEDFTSALKLNKDELFDFAMIGFNMHFRKGKALSECIAKMVETMKAKGVSELKIFAVGMIFCQTLEMAKEEDLAQELKKHGPSNSTRKNKKTMPFNAKDLMKSVRDEMENKTSKGPEDIGSN